MSELQIFKFDDSCTLDWTQDSQGRKVVCGSALAASFGIRNPTAALRRIAPKYKVLLSKQTPGGQQDAVYLYEPGVYEFLATVRVRQGHERAEWIRRFREWLYEVVLPSIRETGAYAHKPAAEAASLSDVAAALRDFGQKFQAIERAISYRESIEPVGLIRCREYADWMGYSITDDGMQAVGRRLSSIGNSRRMKYIFEKRGEGEYRLWPVAFLQEWDAVFRANLVDEQEPLAIGG